MANCICSSMSKLSVSGNTTLKTYEGFKAGATFRLSAPVQTRSTVQVAQRAPVKIMAARVANVEIPNAKRIATSLTYVYGIGPTTANKILEDLDMENKRTYDLSEEELTTLRAEVDKYTVEGDLRRQIALDIKRLKEIGCYRGRRHWAGLPVRGQRCKNNARTRKGRASAIPGKKK